MILMNRSSKEQNLHEIEIFSNIVNVFTVTFYILLLNKTINFFWKNTQQVDSALCLFGTVFTGGEWRCGLKCKILNSCLFINILIIL